MFNMLLVFTIAASLLCASTVQAAPAEDLNSTSTTAPTELPSTSPTTPTQEVETTTQQRICHGRTPCGWAVYTPFVRRIEYFMKNVCICPSDKKCVRSHDDLSLSAYVYRCGDEPAPHLAQYEK